MVYELIVRYNAQQIYNCNASSERVISNLIYHWQIIYTTPKSCIETTATPTRV